MEAKKEKEYIMYKIICNTDETLIYIGSTINFRVRKNKHKSDCNNINSKKQHIKVYENIRNNGGWNNWKMQPIEIYNTDNIIKARIRENELMIEYNSTLNCCKAYISMEEKKEYYKKHKEDNIEHYKKYKDDNKIKMKEYHKEYYGNKEDKKNYQKEIYQRTKNKEYNTKNTICDCGSEIRQKSMKRHLITKHHQKYLCGLIKEEEK